MTKHRPGTGFFSDERETHSMGRMLLACTSAYIYGAIAVDTFTHFHLGAEAWLILSTMEGAFVVWTAGPRIAQYLAPIVTKGIESVSDAIRKRRDPTTGHEATP